MNTKSSDDVEYVMKKILIKSRCNNELTLDSQCYALIRLIRPERNRCVMRWMEAVNVLAY